MLFKIIIKYQSKCQKLENKGFFGSPWQNNGNENLKKNQDGFTQLVPTFKKQKSYGFS